MTERKPWNAEVSSLLNNIYRCADKSNWYSAVASAYDRTRPRYPNKLMSRLQQIVKLKPNQRVLEIGSGPGIASLELAKLGVKLLGIEPSLAACEIARQKCANYPNVGFLNSTFEDWKPRGKKFDVVVASTSFHWITPEIRTQKSAAILKDDGSLILLWNTPPQPDGKVLRKLVPVYQKYAPELAQQESLQHHQANLTKFGREILDSSYFEDLISDFEICELSYAVDEYLTLLTTLSPYINLKPSQCSTLLRELKQVLELNYGDRLKLSYLSMFQIAHKSC